jgi:hypothetical protein
MISREEWAGRVEPGEALAELASQRNTIFIAEPKRYIGFIELAFFGYDDENVDRVNTERYVLTFDSWPEAWDWFAAILPIDRPRYVSDYFIFKTEDYVATLRKLRPDRLGCPLVLMGAIDFVTQGLATIYGEMTKSEWELLGGRWCPFSTNALEDPEYQHLVPGRYQLMYSALSANLADMAELLHRELWLKGEDAVFGYAAAINLVRRQRYRIRKDAARLRTAHALINGNKRSLVEDLLATLETMEGKKR